MAELDLSGFNYDFSDDDEEEPTVNERAEADEAREVHEAASAPPSADNSRESARGDDAQRNLPSTEPQAARAPHPPPPPRYSVGGTKKGSFPVHVESRRAGKKVTIISNVAGDSEAFLRDLKGALGTGGVARGADVEVQGDHLARVTAWLTRVGCIAGVSAANKSAALPPAKASKPKQAKSIKALDAKAAAHKAGGQRKR